MSDWPEKGRTLFRAEAAELLADLETRLLELEERPSDKELISSVFRTLHTIKGSGAMFGFDRIAAFAHELETIFDMVRSGSLTITKELIDLTLRARDIIMEEFDAPSEDAGDGFAERSGAIISSLRELTAGDGETPDAALGPVSPGKERNNPLKI